MNHHHNMCHDNHDGNRDDDCNCDHNHHLNTNAPTAPTVLTMRFAALLVANRIDSMSRCVVDTGCQARTALPYL